MGIFKQKTCNLFLLACFSFLFMGCSNYTKIMNYRAHDMSKTENHDVSFFAIPSDNVAQLMKRNEYVASKSSGQKVPALLDEDDAGNELKKVFSTCGLYDYDPKEKALLEAVALPIVGAIGKLIISNHIDEVTTKGEAIVKAAKQNYSTTKFMTNKEFKDTQCLMIARKSTLVEDVKPTENIGSPYDLVVILKKNEIDSTAFNFHPLYAEIDKSVATTSIDKPQITLSVALALKMMGTQDSKIPGLFPLGTGAVTIPGLNLDDNHFIGMDSLVNSQSEMIPYANSDDRQLSVSVSVVESGAVGFNFEQAKTELEATKEALGPAIETSINAFTE